MSLGEGLSESRFAGREESSTVLPEDKALCRREKSWICTPPPILVILSLTSISIT